MYLLAVSRVDGVGERASAGDIGSADIGFVGHGAEGETGHLAQVRLAVGDGLRDLVARLLARLVGILGCVCECNCSD